MFCRPKTHVNWIEERARTCRFQIYYQVEDPSALNHGRVLGGRRGSGGSHGRGGPIRRKDGRATRTKHRSFSAIPSFSRTAGPTGRQAGILTKQPPRTKGGECNMSGFTPDLSGGPGKILAGPGEIRRFGYCRRRAAFRRALPPKKNDLAHYQFRPRTAAPRGFCPEQTTPAADDLSPGPSAGQGRASCRPKARVESSLRPPMVEAYVYSRPSVSEDTANPHTCSHGP